MHLQNLHLFTYTVFGFIKNSADKPLSWFVQSYLIYKTNNAILYV